MSNGSSFTHCAYQRFFGSFVAMAVCLVAVVNCVAHLDIVVYLADEAVS